MQSADELGVTGLGESSFARLIFSLLAIWLRLLALRAEIRRSIMDLLFLGFCEAVDAS